MCFRNIAEETSHTIRNLLPFNPYNFFLSYCSEKKALSMILSERTKKDAPGPVRNHLIIKDNGIVLKWEEPINPNGVLDHYWIQWNLDSNESRAINISAIEDYFRFPNSTNDDVFNISIRAIGEAGIGNPLYINLAKFKDIPMKEAGPRNWYSPIIVIMFLVILFILLMTLFLCLVACGMRKKGSKNQISVNQVPQPPVTITDNVCNIDMQEMQTLINRTDANTILPNGRQSHDQTNGTPNEIQRILIVTSTPNKSHNEIEEQLMAERDEIPVIDMEFPNDFLQISIGDPTIIKKPENGQKLNIQNVHYIKSLHNSQKPNSPLSPAAAVEHPEKYSPKLHVNLRITENPQVSYLTFKFVPNTKYFF